MYDRFNCSFAIHYLLSDDNSWNNFSENINMYLRDGGYFIFETFDGDRIKEKLPADITLNLINKYYEAIKSYYAKLELKMKACKPKYLDKDSKFSLFYYPSSFKIVNNKTEALQLLN